jgi:phage shock protein C
MARNVPLRRPRKTRMIAGVVAAGAEYFDLDLALARVMYVVVSILLVGFPGILVYVCAWILIPSAEDGS